MQHRGASGDAPASGEPQHGSSTTQEKGQGAVTRDKESAESIGCPIISASFSHSLQKKKKSIRYPGIWSSHVKFSVTLLDQGIVVRLNRI